jgi:outer membrane protein assembly factor BamB
MIEADVASGRAKQMTNTADRPGFGPLSSYWLYYPDAGSPGRGEVTWWNSQSQLDGFIETVKSSELGGVFTWTSTSDAADWRVHKRLHAQLAALKTGDGRVDEVAVPPAAFFVSPKGDDYSASGTSSAAPLRTLAHARSQAWDALQAAHNYTAVDFRLKSSSSPMWKATSGRWRQIPTGQEGPRPAAKNSAGGLKTDDHQIVPPVKHEIGWWFGCPKTADDPGVNGVIKWAKEHRRIIHTLIMHCGIYTCLTNYSIPVASRKYMNNTCLNNGGIGGEVTGKLQASGKKLLPELTSLGIKVELWLGEDDSRQSALHMFKNPTKFAADLIAVAKANPGLTGFNLDLESRSIAEDAQLSVPFLTEVTAKLNAAPGGRLRFSTDVACHAVLPCAGLICDCPLLASSGINKIMNMATYDSTDFKTWYEHGLTPALAEGIPRGKIGAGLGVWNDSRVQPWNLSPKSAEERICALMNHSFQELDLFILSQGNADPKKRFPYDFWVPELEKFVAGGGCPMPFLDPDPMVPLGSCPVASAGMPINSWVPGGEVAGCCMSSSNRIGKDGPHHCNETCARKECEDAGAKPGESWHWKAENYSEHPYECCNVTTGLKSDDDCRKEWRQFQGGAARQGRLSNAVAGPSTNATHQVIKLGNGSQSMAVVGLNGTLFVPTENHLGQVKAFGADGQEIWSYQVWSELHPTTERVVSPPALSLDGLTLYVADAYYTVIALNASTGKQLWNVSTCIPGKIPNACGEIMGPLLLDDYRNGLYFGAADGWIYKANLNAHHHTSANLVWYTFIGSESMSGPSVLPLIGVPHVFSTTQPNGGDGTIHALTAGVGQIKWSADVAASISVPTIDQQGNVYFGSTRGVVYSFDTHGMQRWNYTYYGGAVNATGFRVANTSPAIASDGTVFVTGCQSSEPGERGLVTCWGHLSKLNGTTGELLWSIQSFNKNSRGFGGSNAELGTPIVAESPGIPTVTVYLSHNDGTIYSIDGASGDILWSFDSGVAISGYMSLASDGRLIVPTGGGPVHRQPGDHRAHVNCSMPTACALLIFKDTPRNPVDDTDGLKTDDDTSAAARGSGGGGLDCLFGVNVHTYTGLFNNLSSTMRQHLGTGVTSLYGLGHGSGNHAPTPVGFVDFIDHPTQLFQPNTSYWQLAWTTTRASAPAYMAGVVLADVKRNSNPNSNVSHPESGVVMLDYEPAYHPSWRFQTNARPDKRWEALVSAVHTPALDLNWTTLVGWTVPPQLAGQGWGALSAAQQDALMGSSWDYFCQKYLSAGMDAIRAALPGQFSLAVWNWPYKFGGTTATNATALNEFETMVAELDWLWAKLDIFLPDLYPEFYVGTAASMPSVLSACTVPRGLHDWCRGLRCCK